MKSMVATINKLQLVCKGQTEYNTGLYYAKYILSLAFCLPARRVDTAQGGVDMDGQDNAKDLYENHAKQFQEWRVANTMLTRKEITDFINKNREDNKNKELQRFNALSDEDRAIMKDMKDLRLRIPGQENDAQESNGPNGPDNSRDAEYDEQGAEDFAPPTENPDQMNEELLD
jgi:hypothetical protein